jgi:hypothetical protein
MPATEVLPAKVALYPKVIILASGINSGSKSRSQNVSSSKETMDSDNAKGSSVLGT